MERSPESAGGAVRILYLQVLLRIIDSFRRELDGP